MVYITTRVKKCTTTYRIPVFSYTTCPPTVSIWTRKSDCGGFMNQRVRNNRYFRTAREFRERITAFLEELWPQISDEMRSCITDNFQVVKAKSLTWLSIDHGDQAIIIKYKVGQKASELVELAEDGLAQIADKRPSTQVKTYDYVKRLLHLCLAFCGKEAIAAIWASRSVGLEVCLQLHMQTYAKCSWTSYLCERTT